jgi:hypothetical protein
MEWRMLGGKGERGRGIVVRSHESVPDGLEMNGFMVPCCFRSLEHLASGYLGGDGIVTVLLPTWYLGSL